MSILTKVDSFVIDAFKFDSPWQSPVDDTNYLRARTYHPHGCYCMYKDGAGDVWPYKYDGTSVWPDDDLNYIKPDDVDPLDAGRWCLNESEQHNHDDRYSNLVTPSVTDNFVSFSGLDGTLQDSGFNNLDFAEVVHSHDADEITVDASGFTGNLSATDTDVQTALETIDAMTSGGSAPEPGTITRDGDGLITSVALTSKTITVNRTSGYISTVNDETTLWTFTRDAENRIASWTVGVAP